MKTPARAAAAAVVIGAAAALSACGQSGASDSSAAPTATSVSPSQSTASDDSTVTSSNMMLLPQGSLMLQVPADAITEATTTYDDGMQQTYYDSRGSIPLTVVVEYYAAGAKPAASILAAEQQALAAQSIQPKIAPAEVPGGTGGNRLDWQVKAIPPWLQDRKTAEVPITCSGIIVNGPGGESYGVYVFADPKNKESLDRMSSVLSSLTVNAS
ncbi:hypothetical protein [Actinomyces naeslundii]|uniref:hypothetical protein n=1 Tax=Actinomyces naeslundii TaxID=1655 RepID=UPI00096DC4AB|nr:hypothetical protein [Actinomyces naeslundii]OMG20834.1 hypothetical protein BKH38_04130 [Actinomyces naeslundii]